MSEDSFSRFRSQAPLNQVIIGVAEDKNWKYYDYGPSPLREGIPLLCFPGLAGTSNVFYKVMLSLGAKGYRVMSLHYPPFWSHEEFCDSLAMFLDTMSLGKVHLLGAGLGGFLVQFFACLRPQRVLSLILTNTFVDTQYFNENAPCYEMFRIAPAFLLRRQILKQFPRGQVEVRVAQSIDFIVGEVERLKQQDLASRLTLNCLPAQIPPMRLNSSKITIIDAFDDTSVPDSLKDEIYARYTDAHLGMLKGGGIVPYISRSDEYSVQVEVHLRRNSEWKQQPQEE